MLFTSPMTRRFGFLILAQEFGWIEIDGAWVGAVNTADGWECQFFKDFIGDIQSRDLSYAFPLAAGV